METNSFREYDLSECVHFRKTQEKYGALSNMAPGFPLEINGIYIRTTEVLYQACRYPHLPEIQRMLLSERSPMTAKMKSKPYRQQSREDWDLIRVRIMMWCLRVKLAQNFDSFAAVLRSTGSAPIVEFSQKDDFWGAKPVDNHKLKGVNALGRLLMKLRDELVESKYDFSVVSPANVPNFLLLGKEIGEVTKKNVAVSTPKYTQAKLY